MSKQYAHLHAMAKTSVKFQNDWPKTVGGVALTSQLLTNGQTDERTGHGTPISHLRANAGATIKKHTVMGEIDLAFDINYDLCLCYSNIYWTYR